MPIHTCRNNEVANPQPLIKKKGSNLVEGEGSELSYQTADVCSTHYIWNKCQLCNSIGREAHPPTGASRSLCLENTCPQNHHQEDPHTEHYPCSSIVVLGLQSGNCIVNIYILYYIHTCCFKFVVAFAYTK